jgi:F420-non-reducing hydrogenase iron-sulfur subunit
MLAQFGIDPRRFRLEWVSASEGDRYAQVVNETIETVRALGPLAWKQRLADSDTGCQA